jgi:hypothetical protein
MPVVPVLRAWEADVYFVSLRFTNDKDVRAKFEPLISKIKLLPSRKKPSPMS